MVLMNSFIWILQIVLAVVLFFSGSIILLFREKLKTRLSWINTYGPFGTTLICLAKIAGAAGLIIPWYSGIIPVLTPIAAGAIALFMFLAFRYHLQHQERKDIPATVLFFTLAILIAIYRF